MKISVVIPAYNAASTISEAISSSTNQTYLAHEIIVVDDASTDNTCKMVDSFNNVQLIRQENNQGPSAARNKGWDIATGDLIAFLDSDDIWHPQKLEVINELFCNHDALQYLGHEYSIDSFAVIDKNRRPKLKSFTSILLKNPYQPSCLVVRKELPERFDETYRYCEDHELSVRIAAKYNCHYVEIPLTKLGRPQLTTGGASANKWKMRLGELRIYTNTYKSKTYLLPFTPLLWLFSFSKMLFRSLFK